MTWDTESEVTNNSTSNRLAIDGLRFLARCMMSASGLSVYLLLFLSMSVDCVLGKVLECTEAVQGDVILGHYQRSLPGRRRVTRAATSYQSDVWPNNTVPYVIAPRFSESTKLKIRRAMNTWEKSTCIRFVPRDNQTDYVDIQFSSGCCSLVGRQGGQQYLVLGYGCHTLPIILHELGHLIGFWHEQGRPDRDEYVEILYKNVRKGEVHNFEKRPYHTVTSLGQPFDYRSIMLYGTNVFSRNNRRTIKPKISTFNLQEQGFDYFYAHTRRGATRLSHGDILQANLFFRCPYSYKNGGILVGTQGNLTSPNYPKPYEKSRDTTWTILADQFDASKMMSLVFEEFSVGVEEPDGECRGDYLEVREGKGPLASYLTKICGTKVLLVIAVIHDSLFIKLHSTNSTKTKPHPTLAAHQPLFYWWWRRVQQPVVEAVGFSLRYRVSDCKHVLTELNGTLKSPDYPSSYRQDIDCIWQISAPEGFRIHIIFEDFDFRPVDNDDGCLDYLEIREGDKMSSKFLSLNCGRDFPKDMITQSNQLRLFMHSGSGQSRRGAGFKAHYKSVDIDECGEQVNICEQGCLNTPGGYTCGCYSAYLPVYLDAKQVKCVDIDECQTNNGNCSHGCTNTHGSHFCTCPSGYYLQKDGRTCKDSDECRLSICSQKCINTPGSFICSCKYGYVLDSDKKTCKLAIPMCTGALTAAVGKFTSPPIPSWYHQGSVDCEWTIRVRQRYTIGMYLTLSWSRDSKCRDFVKVSLNEGLGMQTLKLCGQQDVQGLLHFKAHELRVHYHTEAPYPEGFSLSYHMRPKKEELCGGTLDRPRGTIQSPQYPQHYPSRSNCLWKIKSKHGMRISLFFEMFDLEQQSHCIYDYVDIKARKMASKRMRPIGRFCGTKKPPLIGAKDEELWLRFKSDGTVQKRGFRAKYYLV